VAQSECCNGVPLANYWMHNGYINVDNRKMSKSLGNFFTVRDVAEQYGYEPIRFLMVASHYRTPINYSVEVIEQCKAALERLYNCRDNLRFLMENSPAGEKEGERQIRRRLDEYQDHFIEAMEDDMNTADAISALFDLARDINTNLNASTAPSKELCAFALNLFNELSGVMGLLYANKEVSLDEEIEKLIAERTEARKNKDWATADRIRDELKARHVVLEDTPQGIKWKIEQ
jgi:cysteinyl-tRNA synthetase